jgi:hypothetical protein
MSENGNGNGDGLLIPSARRNGNGTGHAAWGRQGGGGASEERVTSRVRRMAEGLPGWEPLPPGEILIRRPSKS